MSGPRGGRVTAITGVRSQHCTFMGGTGGGVFKTENCGDTWVPISDGQMSTVPSVHRRLRIQPERRLRRHRQRSDPCNVIIGRGAYKSTDAGRWQFIGLKEAGQIGSILVHPKNPDVVWAAALGSSFGPTADRGVFKSTDGGKTWKKTLFVDPEHGARVLALNMSNPNELYAGMYRGFRKGWDIIKAVPRPRGHLQVHRRRRDLDEALDWLPATADRQDRHRHRAQPAEHRLRDDRGARRPGRALSLRR